jgi:endonuclease/exonuclease/phosphatase family metal-dependent hydrolase
VASWDNLRMLRVMSFNILCANCGEGVNAWEHRKSLVLERILAFTPDLLGLQECRADGQAQYLIENLPGYTFFGTPRGGEGTTALEMAPLMVREERFDLLASSCFWLSERSDEPGSLSWGALFPRTVSWARLRVKDTRQELLFVNTHFDLVPASRWPSAELLRTWLCANIAGSSVILTGDFNANKRSRVYETLTSGGLLADAWRQANPGSRDKATFHGFGNPKARSCIDWVLISSGLQAVSASVDTFLQIGRYPSDHYPLRVEIE